MPIYKTVSPPLTHFLLLLYVYTLEQKNLLIKAEKELCGSAGGEVFFLFFRVWHGLGWLTVCSQELEVAKRAPHLGRGLENELLCH